MPKLCVPLEMSAGEESNRTGPRCGVFIAGCVIYFCLPVHSARARDLCCTRHCTFCRRRLFKSCNQCLKLLRFVGEVDKIDTVSFLSRLDEMLFDDLRLRWKINLAKYCLNTGGVYPCAMCIRVQALIQNYVEDCLLLYLTYIII